MMAVKTLSDEEALTVAAVFPEWSADSVNYKKDDRVRYGDTLYKCLQDHPSQASWTPDVAPSLWVRVDDPTVEWPEWVQPVSYTHLDVYKRQGWGISSKCGHRRKDACGDGGNSS